MRFRGRITDEYAAKCFTSVTHFMPKLWKTVYMRVTPYAVYFTCPPGVTDGSPQLHVKFERDAIFSQFMMDGVTSDFNEIYLKISSSLLDKVFDTLRTLFVTVQYIRMNLAKKDGACLQVEIGYVPKSMHERSVSHMVPVEVVPFKDCYMFASPKPHPFDMVVFFPTSKSLWSIVSGYKGPAGTRAKLIFSRRLVSNEIKGILAFEVESDDHCFHASSDNLSIPDSNRVPLCSNYDEICRALSARDEAIEFAVWLKLKQFASVIQACDVLRSEEVAFGVSSTPDVLYFSMQPGPGLQVEILMSCDSIE